MHTVKTFTRMLYPELISYKLRRRRFVFFLSLLEQLPPPVSILDVGGTRLFWEYMDFTRRSDVAITLLNRSQQRAPYPNMRSLAGNACHMPEFADKSFDIVFSNSVIEHVGSYTDQSHMAHEVQRIGKSYFIQTPNRHFPIEPHFMFPFFQFLPVPLRIFLVDRLNLGWQKQKPPRSTIAARVKEIRLLTEKECKHLFPGSTVYREKLLGLTKSFTIYAGFPDMPHSS